MSRLSRTIIIFISIIIVCVISFRFLPVELWAIVIVVLANIGRYGRRGSRQIYSHYNFYDYDNLSDRYYDNLLDSYEKYNSSHVQVENSKSVPVQKQVSSVTKIDVNSCSEEQLVALPGINVILAKRIIQTREELGGFTTIEQFVNTLGINSSMANILSELVTFKEPKYIPKIKRRTERNIDL